MTISKYAPRCVHYAAARGTSLALVAREQTTVRHHLGGKMEVETRQPFLASQSQ